MILDGTDELGYLLGLEPQISAYEAGHLAARLDAAAIVSRTTAMRVIAWLLIGTATAFSLFTVVFAFVGLNQDIHAVHNVVVTSLIMVLTVPPLVVVARRPEESGAEPLILAALTVAGVVAMAVSLAPDPFTLPVLVLIAVLWFLAPTRDVPWGEIARAS